jgi:hypothetical protein
MSPALLIEAAKRGLDALTLYPTTGGRWQASTRWRGSDGWRITIGDDPVQALHLALADVIAESPPQPEPASIFD